jgi:hypothetical protein
VRLSLAGVPLLALVDTGASRTLLQRDSFLEICANIARSPILQRSHGLCTLSGEHIPVLGETQVTEDKVGPLNVVVVTTGVHQLILGADELQRGGATLDFTSHTLLWHGVTFTVECESQVHLAHVYPVESAGLIQQTVSKNADVFAGNDTPLGDCPLVQMKIDTGSARPISQKPYRTPLTKRKIIEEQITSMLKKGVIRPSSSPWASPVTLVPKKDGGTRFCIDYRKVNDITKKDRYPLPQIQDIFDQLGGASICSTLDVESGY